MAFRAILILCAFFTFSLTPLFGATPFPSPYKIGVIQIVEHPALDETCRGIQDELALQGLNPNLQWSWESAQGNPALATQIAAKYMGQKVSLMIAIGTTVAQAALNAAQGSQTPVIFASVTDPKAAKLTGNITGVSNFVPLSEQFSYIMKILPDKKRIGVIYNPGEANSDSLMIQMQATAKQMGLEILSVPALRTSEVSMAVQGLMGKVDAIFINNDNTALAALPAIGRICRDNKVPLFASDGDLKESGALAIIGADQYEIGRQTGRMVTKILKGDVQISDLAVEYPTKINVSINDEAAKTLGITIPEVLKIKGGKS